MRIKSLYQLDEFTIQFDEQHFKFIGATENFLISFCSKSPIIVLTLNYHFLIESSTFRMKYSFVTMIIFTSHRDQRLCTLKFE